MRTLVLDIEANGLLLDATKIWCVVVMDYHTKEVFVANSKEELLSILGNSDNKVIAHNGIMYDLPVLRRLWNIDINIDYVYDTLLISRLFMPDRPGGHSLEAWGARFNSPKGDYSNFTDPDMEKLVEYCKQDVLITHKIYQILLSEFTLYDQKPLEAIKLEHRFAWLINKQIEAGFAVDEAYMYNLYLKYKAEFELYYNKLQEMLPSVKDLSHYKSVVNKKLLLSENSTGYTYTCRNAVKTVPWKYLESNPTSRQQIADYLISKGWVPKVFTETGLPKVDENTVRDIKVEGADIILRVFKLQKKLGMLHDGEYGWMKCVRNGRIHGDIITNGANTGRCTHSKPNVAQSDSDPEMRACWIAAPGKVLVGVDAASLELRILGHYLSKYDKGAYAYEIVRRSKLPKDQDIHCYTQQLVGLSSRDEAKTMIYALIYGAGNAKLGKIKTKTLNEDINRNVGYKVRESIFDSFTGYKELTDEVKKFVTGRGYLFGIDRRPLHPRSDYAALNLLIQSGGAVVMKQALVNSYKIMLDRGLHLGVHYNYVGNIHDEIQIECDQDKAEVVKQSVIDAIVKAGEDFKLRCPMAGEGKIGNNWSETH